MIKKNKKMNSIKLIRMKYLKIMQMRLKYQKMNIKRNQLLKSIIIN